MIREKTNSISWQAPEYTYHKKTKEWYWALAIVAAALIGIGVYQQNFLFIFLILLSGFAILIFAVRRPETASVTISGQGVQINDLLYPFESLSSFWIFYQPDGIKELSIKSDKFLMPHIKIPLGETNPNEIRSLLLNYLPEKAQDESASESIARWLGF